METASRGCIATGNAWARAGQSPGNIHARPRRFSQADARGAAWHAGLSAQAASRKPHATRLRPLAGGRESADDGAIHRQPALASVLRQRSDFDERRLRPARRSAVASRIARLPGDGADSAGLELEATAAADRHVGDLSAVVASFTGAAGS